MIDDARSHLSLIRMLRQFHYIDQNGKDQGINVRNRSSELVKLLSDVDMIRAERKKARANRHKYGGFEGGGGLGGISGSRMQGFGSENMTFGGAYSGGVFGDGGGFGGASTDFHDAGPRSNRFEAYDEDEVEPISGRRPNPVATRREQPKKPEPKKEPEPDLVDFGDDDTSAPTTTSTAAGKKPAGGGLDILDSKPVDDDDFDDFQSATPSTQPAPSSIGQFTVPAPPAASSVTPSSTIVAPQPVSASQAPNLNGIVGLTSPTSSAFSSPLSGTPTLSQPAKQQPPPLQQQKPLQTKPTSFQPATPNYFASVSANLNSPSPATGAITTSGTPASPFSSTASTTSAATNATKPAASKSGGDAFGSLWSAASAGAGIQKSSSAANKGPNLASMAKEKSSAGIWGTPSQSSATSPAPTLGQSLSQTSSSQKPQPGSSSGLDDLLG